MYWEQAYMKGSVRKLVERLRARLGGPAHVPRSEPPSESSLPFTTDGTEFKSGETVFDDRALRFRTLTTSDAATTGLEEAGAEHAAFKIRVARREGFQDAAGTLIERRYSDRGYQSSRKRPEDPNLYTFVAYDEGELVGTVGVRIDSERGLSADDLYKDEIDQLRAAGCRLCEYTRLALDHQAVSKPVLAGLFHTAWMFTYYLRNCDFAVIEVNPRHAPFYRRALMFEPIGQERFNTRVSAPAVLLCLQNDRFPPQIQKYGGRPELANKTRLMFPYWFGEAHAEGILSRLRELDRERNAQ
jgi:hypothetical protein